MITRVTRRFSTNTSMTGSLDSDFTIRKKRFGRSYFKNENVILLDKLLINTSSNYHLNYHSDNQSMIL